MILLLDLLCILITGAGILWALSASGTRAARWRALLAAGLCVGVSGWVLVVPRPLTEWTAEFLPDLPPPTWARGALFVTCVVGWVATALADIERTTRRQLAQTLALIGVALAFLIASQPFLLAALWVASGLLAWLALRDFSGAADARAFLYYHSASAILFVAGVSVQALGNASFATVLLLGAIVVRQALLPAHGWFTHFVERAPMGVVVAFVGPQLGVYAHLVLLAPGLAPGLGHAIALLGGATAVYAAALGAGQPEARRAVGYLVLSQSGLVAFGLDNGTLVAQSGAVLMWFTVALATSAFAMSVSALEARRGALRIGRTRGNFASTPLMATAVLVLGFASVGLPATVGFVAEDLLLQGSVKEFPWLALCLIAATALNGINVMRIFFGLFTGARQGLGEPDLVRREWLPLTFVLAVLLASGLAPQWMLGRVVGDDLTPSHAEAESGVEEAPGAPL